jgi:hypothetical protein
MLTIFVESVPALIFPTQILPEIFSLLLLHFGQSVNTTFVAFLLVLGFAYLGLLEALLNVDFALLEVFISEFFLEGVEILDSLLLILIGWYMFSETAS